MIRESDDRLYVSGPVTLENVMQYVHAVERFLDGTPRVFDFSEVKEIDSASVSLMLEWSRQARAGGARVRFANLGESIRSLIELYGVADLIQLDA